MHSRRSLKNNFFWQLGIELTNMLLPLVTSPLISRRMGAEALGIYSYVYTVTYYFIQFALLGMYQYGTREIAMVRDNEAMRNRRFSELVTFQLIHGGLVFAAYLLYALFFSAYTELMLLNLLYLFGASVLLINYVFAGLEEFHIIATKTMIIRVTGFLLIVLFVQSREDLPLYTLIMAAEPLAGALVYLFLARGRVQYVKVPLRNSFRHMRGLYLIFIPILAMSLYGSMDKLMLGRMSGMEQLGFYTNAEKTLIAKNLAVSVSIVLVPRMSNLVGNSDKATFDKLLNQSLEIVFLLTTAFGFGTAAVSSVFSVVFWGAEFSPCSDIIQIMSFTLPAYGLTYVINHQYLIPVKKERIYILSTTLGVAVNFLLNAALIPRFAALGAAVATLITQFAVLVCECAVIRRSYSVLRVVKGALAYVAFGAVMYFAVRYLDGWMTDSLFTLAAEIAAGAAIFSALCLCWWTLRKKTIYLSLLRDILWKARAWIVRN